MVYHGAGIASLQEEQLLLVSRAALLAFTASRDAPVCVRLCRPSI